jgi:GTPase SAR1 family protein
LTRRDTLSGLEHYAAQLRQLNPKAVTVFVGNKADLIETRAISDEDLQALSAKLNSPCFLSSAKTGENVENAFLNLAERIEAEP